MSLSEAEKARLRELLDSAVIAWDIFIFERCATDEETKRNTREKEEFEKLVMKAIEEKE